MVKKNKYEIYKLANTFQYLLALEGKVVKRSKLNWLIYLFLTLNKNLKDLNVDMNRKKIPLVVSYLNKKDEEIVKTNGFDLKVYAMKTKSFFKDDGLKDYDEITYQLYNQKSSLYECIKNFLKLYSHKHIFIIKFLSIVN